MPSGFIKVIGEHFPITEITPLPDEKRPLRKQLVFIQQAAKPLPDPIDYRILIKIGDRKRPLEYYAGQIFREAQTKFKRLVEIARKERTNTLIQFWANDFLFEKYDHE